MDDTKEADSFFEALKRGNATKALWAIANELSILNKTLELARQECILDDKED